MGTFFVLLSLCLVSLAGISFSQRQNINKIASLNNQLASEIHRKLSAEGDNIIFSPLSISTALAMLFYGARGKTAEEMRYALGYKILGLTDRDVHSAFQVLMETIREDSAAEKYVLYVANAILTQRNYPILSSYKNGLQEIYKATASEVDFQNAQKALQDINNWVKQKTDNRIQKLLENIDRDTVVVLLNAVYFKGTWKTQFDPKNTMEKVFFNNGLESERVRVPMMYLSEELPFARLKGATALELPYKSADISMFILLPDDMNGLAGLEQGLTSNMITDIIRQTRKTKLHVSLPRFKVGYKKTLNTILQELGIRNVFEDSANLTGITWADPVAVSQVLHKAVVEVNEEGSEASAATAVSINIRTGGFNKEHFDVNHPFLFAVVDKRNDMILFQGRVNRL